MFGFTVGHMKYLSNIHREKRYKAKFQPAIAFNADETDITTGQSKNAQVISIKEKALHKRLLAERGNYCHLTYMSPLDPYISPLIASP